MKNTLNEETVKQKLTEEDKKVVENLAADTLRWIEGNPDASAEEYENKQKEVEQKFHPIMTKLYQGGAGPSMPQPDVKVNGGTSKGPTIDDVDQRQMQSS
eukprot:TRINITY_DN29100_c0_g1_i1.p2 TRINITY_DN29100_c0_g1~~TRINITY_DN29100_c0_g1_i1.p2  ORF type:complete len:110 (-),score=16.41 TRINITY_DN29100_c0_g1_i1:59-358(-)